MSQSTEHDDETKPPQSKLLLTHEKSIGIVSKLLNDLVEGQDTQVKSCFDSDELSSIPFEVYLRRIQKHTKYSPESLIIAVSYIDRYNLAVEDFCLNYINAHRLLLVCLMLAVKFQDDIYFDNKTFQRAGGICTAQLLDLQIEVFEKLQFTTFVDQASYEALIEKLITVYYE